MEEASGRVGGQGQQSCYADRIAKVTTLRLFHSSVPFAWNVNILGIFCLYQWVQSVWKLLKQCCDDWVRGPEALCMSCSSSHSVNWARNPGENTLQLLVHPDGVFYALLRESPLDDTLNEPCRKPLSSLEGPGGKTARTASHSTPPFRLIDREDGVGRPMRLQRGRLGLLGVTGPDVDPVSSGQP